MTRSADEYSSKSRSSTQNALPAQLRELRIHRKGDTPSPHKPLLLLLALGHVQNGDTALLSFEAVEQSLTHLISVFGSTRSKANVSNPFWRLQKDGDFWVVESDISIETDHSGNPSISQLREGRARAGFSQATIRDLTDRPALIAEAAAQLLEDNFPHSLHADIACAVGLQLCALYQKNQRSPNFRQEVLQAHQYRCVVCGFQIRLMDRTIALEAAHVQWFSCDGPDEIDNGLALCPTHHKLFDLGAFTLSADDSYRIRVSRWVEQSEGMYPHLEIFSNKPILLPKRPEHHPSKQYIEWHTSNVYKS